MRLAILVPVPPHSLGMAGCHRPVDPHFEVEQIGKIGMKEGDAVDEVEARRRNLGEFSRLRTLPVPEPEADRLLASCGQEDLFANPAAVMGRMWSDSFAGIAPQSAIAFVLAQFAGGALGAWLASMLGDTK